MAVLSSYIAWHVYEAFLDESGSNINLVAVGAALAFLISCLGAGVYGFYFNARTSSFFIDVDSEAHRITWPVWESVKGATGQVVAVMIFLMVYLFMVDFGLRWIREQIY